VNLHDGRGEVPSQVRSYLFTNSKELRSLPTDRRPCALREKPLVHTGSEQGRLAGEASEGRIAPGVPRIPGIEAAPT